MHFRRAVRSVAAVTLLPLLLAIPHANAATTFYGFDPGGGGVAHPFSDAAHAAFLAALSGMSIGTETFETVPPGSFLDASISVSFPSTTVTGTITDGASPSGLGLVTEVRSSALPPHYFPISGDRFIRVEAGGNPSVPPGLSDFFDITFSSPQTAIGFYGTSFSDYFGATPATIPPIRISLDGGAGIDTLAIDPALVPTGSVNFFGIIADAPFTTARLFNPPGTGNDGIGIDDITIASPAAIPEPSTWALMLAGLVGVVAFTRRKRRIA